MRARASALHVGAGAFASNMNAMQVPVPGTERRCNCILHITNDLFKLENAHNSIVRRTLAFFPIPIPIVFLSSPTFGLSSTAPL